MSNKDRIARKAEEARATASDKEQRAASKPEAPAGRKPRVPAPPPRLKVVWVVCDAARKVVKTYPYPEQAAAQKEAAALTTSTGKEHVVRKDKVPME